MYYGINLLENTFSKPKTTKVLKYRGTFTVINVLDNTCIELFEH